MIRLTTSRSTLFVAVALVLTSCGGTPIETAGPVEGRALAESPVVPLGDRVVAMSISDGAIGFDRSYALVRELGIDATSLQVYWDELEPQPGVYRPDPDWLGIADSFYPPEGMALSLAIAVLDTTEERLPADLAGRNLDDPEVVSRFEQLLEHVAKATSHLDLVALAIGNEVDVRLAATGQWDEYRRFLEAVLPEARLRFPGVATGTKTTYSGLVGEHSDEVAGLHHLGDAVMLTDYLIDDDFMALDPADVGIRFDRAVRLAGGVPVMFLELGYPTDPRLGGSPVGQERFVAAVLAAWDRHAGDVPVVEFTWSSDEPAAAVAEMEDYYGFHDERFAAYLGSIGFVDDTGQPKPGYVRLRRELLARP